MAAIESLIVVVFAALASVGASYINPIMSQLAAAIPRRT